MSNDRSISVYGRKIPVGVEVYRWDHPEGFNGYATDPSVVHDVNRKTGSERDKIIKGRRYGRRANGINDITQFVVHHSGGDGRTPAGMYETLHNQRGLSVHYAIEDDGRVWQFLDPKDKAWHAGNANSCSVGAECCLYPDAGKRPDYYSRKRQEALGNMPHEIAHQRIQGMDKAVFVMPDCQVDSLARVIAGTYVGLCIESQKKQEEFNYDDHATKLWERFRPHPKFPSQGNAIPRSAIESPWEHVGLIGHLHLTRRKWDPAGLNFSKCEELVGQYMEEIFPNYMTKK